MLFYVNTTGGGFSVCCFLVTLVLLNQIPTRESSVKNILNTRCWFQVIHCNTPPQEQGNLGVNAIIYAMYNVNTDMREKEPYNPDRLIRGIKRSPAVTSSTTGNIHASNDALSPIKGDFRKTAVNELNSNSLLTAAYANKRIRNAEMTSTI